MNIDFWCGNCHTLPPRWPATAAHFQICKRNASIDAEFDGESFDAKLKHFWTLLNGFMRRLLNYNFMQ
jgi:hypothetical protein